MNLILRSQTNLNEPTWSIIISLLILLAGVTYYIVTIMQEAYRELEED